ncbi:MAG: hypothetical protein ACI9OJ_001327 [Myxococcota bacterium]|jgi:hypothetical protein
MRLTLTRLVPTLVVLSALVCAGTLLVGCGKDAPKAPSAPAAKGAVSDAKKAEPEDPKTVVSKESESGSAPEGQAPPAVAPKEPVVPKVAPPVAPTESLNDAEKARLSVVFNGVWCIQKRKERQGLAEIYKAHGFKDSVAFSAAWSKAAAVDGPWATATVAAAARQACAPADAQP